MEQRTSAPQAGLAALPAHYSIDGLCAACRGAIKSGAERYRIGEREYHADCFDISLIGPWPPAGNRQQE